MVHMNINSAHTSVHVSQTQISSIFVYSLSFVPLDVTRGVIPHLSTKWVRAFTTFSRYEEHILITAHSNNEEIKGYCKKMLLGTQEEFKLDHLEEKIEVRVVFEIRFSSEICVTNDNFLFPGNNNWEGF